MEKLVSFLKTRQPVNLLLIAANILVFAVLTMRGDTQNASFMLSCGACYPPLVAEGKEYYRIFTCMFLHFGIQHLFYNMIMLLFMGDVLERAAGKIRYLILYLAGGMAGNLLSIAIDLKSGNYAVSAGASGAIFAVVGALVFLVLTGKGRVEEFSAKRLLLMAGLCIAEGFTAAGVDNAAHVGGFAAGFILAAVTGCAAHYRGVREHRNKMEQKN